MTQPLKSNRPLRPNQPFLLALTMGLSSGLVSLAGAHGLIQDPPSRPWICGGETQPDQIQFGQAKTPACSTAFKINSLAAYDYMAVVSHSLGRSKADPLTKNVCGYDSEKWKGTKTPWDAAMNWPTSPVSAGPKTFVWNITWGPHFDDTQEFKYWITKSTFVFSPDKELTWDDFETEPFCVLNYDDKNPNANPKIKPDKVKSLFTTECTLPSRQGHHVVYGEWGRTEPTIERFHSCVDAAFGGTGVILDPARKTKAAKAPMKSPKAPTFDALGQSIEPGRQGLPTLHFLTP